MFIGTDLPHGTMINWSLERPKEAGSFQPIVDVNYERSFSVTLNRNEGKYYFVECVVYIPLGK